MNFLKKHYEKVLLGAVLLGLVVAVILLPFKVANEEADLESQRQKILARRPEPLPPPNVSRTEETLKRLQDASSLNFTLPHNLVNPVLWQKPPVGPWIPVRTGREIGPDRVAVTKISPLHLIVTWESVGASGSNYLIKIEKETELSNTKRKVSGYVALNVKPPRLPLTLREVKGAADKPGELVLELDETGERFRVALDRPYRRVDGYTADLRYEPENRTWRSQREGARLVLAGEEFTLARINLVATNRYEVVLSARLTGKKTTRPFERTEDDVPKATIKTNTAP